MIDDMPLKEQQEKFMQMPDENIDYSDIPPLGDEFFKNAKLVRPILADNHPDVANSLNNLAGLYKSQGRYTEAEPLYLQALAIAEQALGENHPTTVKIRENLESLP